jgi:hypothetical protein
MCSGAAKSPKIAGEVAKRQPRLIVSAAGNIKTGESRALSLTEARCSAFILKNTLFFHFSAVPDTKCPKFLLSLHREYN